MIKLVFCKLLFEALHNWSTIPPEAEACYLSLRHRHVFHITVAVRVSHDDRDVEFIELKHKVEKFLKETYPEMLNGIPFLRDTSCEMLATTILQHFEAEYVIVSEDGENGAIVSRESSREFEVNFLNG
jgi:hypothetical protein